MRKYALLLLVLSGMLLAACGGQVDSGITPATDKLTFLFFYTDG
ncbi:MAG TPA: hypothetical protein VLA72_19270 [Anaerolineales bacterium]|nr:hypothetical protein [Anaerolineales bacterium]